MPKLWNETIEAHRSQVHDAILDTTAALVFEQGLRGVTMSQIAERTGIGRATLYKYFPDVEAILRVWHARQIGTHISELTRVRQSAGSPGERLDAVLTAYAHIAHQTGSHDRQLVKFLHPDERIVDAQTQLRQMVRQLIEAGADTGELRNDIAPDELANYCLHALSAAAELTTSKAIDRLVAITVSGLRPESR
ncbi:TetR/AcrR family transcriptional regulator [Nocardia sp. KC 131]|uniref:TetR/AcrR family transcriptional regulator n=1 Tax=Nocardia arseniciresistens TaxID=3392119 RepID=UPI00398EF0DF